MMRQYVELESCRREFLLHYLGEAYDGPCGQYDICELGLVKPTTSESGPFPVTSRVRHVSLGIGTVTHYEDDKIVLFDKGGYRTLSLDLVMDQGLLEARR